MPEGQRIETIFMNPQGTIRVTNKWGLGRPVKKPGIGSLMEESNS